MHRPRIEVDSDRGNRPGGHVGLGEPDELLHRFVTAPLGRTGSCGVHLDDLHTIVVRPVRQIDLDRVRL